MSRNTAVLIISAIIILFHYPLKAAETGWRLSMNKNGVSVYTKPAEDSIFDEFKGTIIINDHIDVLEMVLRDIPAFPLWMSGCKKSPIIEEIDKNNYIFYFVQGLPWPLTDRDTALKAKAYFDRKNGYYTVNFHSIDDRRVPEKAGLIRMYMKGGFILKKIDEDTTMVTFFIKAYPGGSIPGIVANIFSREIPYETLLSMKGIAKKYRSKVFTSAGDPSPSPERSPQYQQ